MSSRLHNDFLASLGYRMRPYFKKQANKQTKIKTNLEHKEQGKEGSPRKTVGTPSVDTLYLTNMQIRGLWDFLLFHLCLSNGLILLRALSFWGAVPSSVKG